MWTEHILQPGGEVVENIPARRVALHRLRHADPYLTVDIPYQVYRPGLLR